MSEPKHVHILCEIHDELDVFLEVTAMTCFCPGQWNSGGPVNSPSGEHVLWLFICGKLVIEIADMLCLRGILQKILVLIPQSRVFRCLIGSQTPKQRVSTNYRDSSLVFDILATVRRRKAYLFTLLISVTDYDKSHISGAQLLSYSARFKSSCAFSICPALSEAATSYFLSCWQGFPVLLFPV